MQANIKYRPDIDGLRALAVFSVIIFHFNDQWLSGGFLGVDVFFVISGYLITSIIKNQLLDGRFCFRVFYTRRIKRILPLFFTVLLVTFVVAAIVLMPEDYRDFWRSARYAMQFRANRAFIGSNYFDIATEEKPLLHLWSLAIEEQFYFIWPLVFFVSYLIAKTFNLSFNNIFWMVISGIIVSTIFAEFSLWLESDNSYYLLQNRAAELLVGCALALSPYNIRRLPKQCLGLIGLVVLIGCIVFYDDKTPIPGLYTLVPTIAAAFFILDDQTESFYKKIFTNKVAKTIGLWSFSLYLWHWPILAFLRYLHDGSEILMAWIIFAVVLTFLLSIMSYYLIENPVRKTKLSFLPSLILIYLIPMSIMTGLNYLRSEGVIFVDREQMALFDTEKTRWFDAENEGCWDEIRDNCSVGDLDAEKHYLLIGDSHAMHLSYMMDIIGKNEGIKFDVIASTACPIYFGYDKVKITREACINVNKYLEDNWQNYDAIVLSQIYYRYIQGILEVNTGIDYLKEFTKTINNLSDEIPVILMSDVPAHSYNPLRAAWLEKNNFLIFTKRPSVIDEHIQANLLVQKISDENSNVTYVDITSYVTELLDSSYLIYRDKTHINPYGSQKLGEKFIKNQRLKIEDAY